MKPQVWVFWTLISLLIIGRLLGSGPVLAQPALTGIDRGASLNTLLFDAGELNFQTSRAIPTSGWQPGVLPADGLSRSAPPDRDGHVVAWARVTFDASQLGREPLALFTENNREHVIIYLNGVEIFRNAPDDDARVMGWNHPYLAPLPSSLLQPQANTIVVRVSSRADLNLSVGKIKIGPHETLVDEFNFKHFVRISGPMAANVTMLFLSLAVALLWLGRRDEPTLLWIVLTGFFWLVRNYHFYAYEAPFQPRLFLEVTYYSIFFAIAASLSFCVDFLKLPNRRVIIFSMFSLCIFLSVARFISVALDGKDGAINIFALLTVIGVTGFLIESWIKKPTPDHPLLVSVVIAIIVFSIHDLGRSQGLSFWDGMGFHTQPYIGVMLFAVFLVSIGRRFIEAMTAVELANQTLEGRISDVTSDLARSEQARRELEVINAVETERERLMREMHDGIGSNLITALAIAKQADESPRTIRTLQRAISDLKITVDSLAPIEGDLVALLANFRHRLEPDLRDAGLTCRWKVQSCQPIPWLDAVNALQMLRIVQEAIGNVLAHAQAKVVEIGAMPAFVAGREGIMIWIADDGVGFCMDAVSKGRGIANMRARAASLQGVFSRQSQTGTGTRVELWLPYVRDQG